MWGSYIVGSFHKEIVYNRNRAEQTLLKPEWQIRYVPEKVDFSTYGDKSYPKGLFDFVQEKGKIVPLDREPSQYRILGWLEERKSDYTMGILEEIKVNRLVSSNDKYWVTVNILDLQLTDLEGMR